MFNCIIKRKWHGTFQRVCCPNVMNGSWIHFSPLSSYQRLLIFLKRLQYQHVFNWNMLLAVVEFSDKPTALSSNTSYAVRKEKKEVLGLEHYGVNGRVVSAVICICTGKLCWRNQTSALEIFGEHNKKENYDFTFAWVVFVVVVVFCWAFFKNSFF